MGKLAERRQQLLDQEIGNAKARHPLKVLAVQLKQDIEDDVKDVNQAVNVTTHLNFVTLKHGNEPIFMIEVLGGNDYRVYTNLFAEPFRRMMDGVLTEQQMLDGVSLWLSFRK